MLTSLPCFWLENTSLKLTLSVPQARWEFSSFERSLTINFSPNIQSGPVYGVRGVRELADLLYDEFNKRIRNELKSRTLYLER